LENKYLKGLAPAFPVNFTFENSEGSPCAVNAPLSPSERMDQDESWATEPTFESTRKKPKVHLDSYNKCAKAILDHDFEKLKWKKFNHDDDPDVRALIYDDDHYLLHSNKSRAKYGNGSLVCCLSKMRQVCDHNHNIIFKLFVKEIYGIEVGHKPIRGETIGEHDDFTHKETRVYKSERQSNIVSNQERLS
jgi:hypothetical protein